jgi:hypothetical protein
MEIAEINSMKIEEIGGMAVYFHFKIKRKKEMLMYLDGKIINCPHCKRNFDLHNQN